MLWMDLKTNLFSLDSSLKNDSKSGPVVRIAICQWKEKSFKTDAEQNEK